MKKKYYFSLFFLCFALFLSGCSEHRYADSVSVNLLASDVIDELDDDCDFQIASKGYLDDYFTKPDYVTEDEIYFARDTNRIDEFGIFHVKEGCSEDMEALLKGYLSNSLSQNRTFYDSYIPWETMKLRDAEVRRIGNYVAYAIMEKEDRNCFFETLKDALS